MSKIIKNIEYMSNENNWSEIKDVEEYHQMEQDTDSDTLYVVLVYATWCGACKMFKPTFQSVAESMKGKNVQFKIINVNNRDVSNVPSNKYNIRNIPTTIYLKNGELVDKTIGNISSNQFRGRVDNLVSDN